MAQDVGPLHPAVLRAGIGLFLRTLIRTHKPAGAHRIWPEPTVTTVLSRKPADVRRDSVCGTNFPVEPRF